MAVRMQHSGLPDGQDIDVADISVSAYERMGWTVVGDRPATENTAGATGRRQTPKESS
ncbi:hypothetical protein [Streptomyces anulatus]|uniref:hypothetical protein n=1 Tax=Streptomyces anulatus TaxID=1892 RepID=UPI002253059F|nr:hypothetical protein [Streptomyces anulatus]MCX4504327.1 hypothetical protein [Streptomyces anulatus]